MESRLYTKYKKEIIPAMQEKFGIKNKMAVPKVEKVTINVGINSRQDNSFQEMVDSTLIRITGQRPVKTRAKKAISAFKVRENMVVGEKVTLRGKKMYDFLDKLVNISIPRIRDFRGLSEKTMDKTGNLTIGFRENNVFPEIKVDEIARTHGLEVVVTTTAKDKETGLELLRLMGFPFQKNNK